MELATAAPAAKPKIKVSNLSHVLRWMDERDARPNDRRRVATRTWEVWAVPIEVPFATLERPYDEVEKTDLVEVLVSSYGPEHLDRGIVEFHEATSATILDALKQYADAHGGKVVIPVDAERLFESRPHPLIGNAAPRSGHQGNGSQGIYAATGHVVDFRRGRGATVR